MGQVLHGSARTTAAVPVERYSIVREPEGACQALRHQPQYGRQVEEAHGCRRLATGPKNAKSNILTIEKEAIIVAFRRHTLLPLDGCLYALQVTIPHLTRSSLHRCLQWHRISRLPEVTGDKNPGGRSRSIRSASFTSTSPRCRRRKESYGCSSPSTEPASSLMSNSIRKRAR